MKEGRPDQQYLLAEHVIGFFMASMPQSRYSSDYQGKVKNAQNILIILICQMNDVGSESDTQNDDIDFSTMVGKLGGQMIKVDRLRTCLLEATGTTRELINCVL